MSIILRCILNISFEGRAWIILAQKVEESVVKIRSQQTKRRGASLRLTKC